MESLGLLLLQKHFKDHERRPSKMKRITSSLILSIFIFSLSTVAFAGNSSSETPSAGAVVFDLLICRPVGFLATLLGSAALIVSLPVTISFNSTGDAVGPLVTKPYEFTFERPIGKW